MTQFPRLSLLLSLLLALPHGGYIAAAAPMNPSTTLNMDDLRKKAFDLCQKPYEKPVVKKVPVLDPPKDGRLNSLGIGYQEESLVTSDQIFAKDDFYFFPKPRLAGNNLALDLFLDKENKGEYKQVLWEDTHPNYSQKMKMRDAQGRLVRTDLGPEFDHREFFEILPRIDKNRIPKEGRVLTELIIGHKAPDGGFPQLFDLRSNSYIRFNGYAPQVTGASLRLGANRVWQLKSEVEDRELYHFDIDEAFRNTLPKEFYTTEDFPVVRAVYASLPSAESSRAVVILESELFCAALDLTMTPGVESSIVNDGYWYMRRDFEWKKDLNTGLVAYSSMLWLTENDTPEYSKDEAHDSDTLRVNFADGSEKKIDISLPEKNNLRVHELYDDRVNHEIKSFSLANEDRNAEHFAHFGQYLHETGYEFRSSYRVEILESSIKTGVRLYENWTKGEYLDNIVALSTIRQDVPKAKSPDQYIHFKYKTTAYMAR